MQNLLGQPATEPEEGARSETSEAHPDGSWRADALGTSRHARLSDHIREPLDDADPERADRICAEVCRDLLLDFAPALMALPAAERRRSHALATYAHLLFDFAARPGVEGERFAALNRVEFTLEQSLDSEPAGQPAFVAMAASERLRPWDREALDSLGRIAREFVVWPRPETAAEAVARSEALGGAVAAGLLGSQVPPSLVSLAGALLRIRSLLVLGEAVRRDRAALPIDELPGRGDIDRPLGRQVVDAAVRTELQRIAVSLESARGAADRVPKAYRRAVRYLRLAALSLFETLEGLGGEVANSPPRLGVAKRIGCMARARLGFG